MKTNELQAGDKITEAVRLVRPLAEGGMGRVWIAEHLGLHAEVVVKLMAPEMAARSDGAERFAREAAIAAAIKSPHVVQVFDHGVTAAAVDEGTPYIVMELLEGKDLGAHLAEHGRMDPADVVTLVVQIGKALSKAHKAAIVHRDIKPDNIFLCDTEGGEIFVKLLDFGTARRDTEASSRTTVPGQIMGTPYYMSPEQSVGSAEVDERSDIWSLGVVVFEALTGQKPFDGASVGAITIAIHGPLPKMTDVVPELPPAVDAWFARACAQAPEDRFPSAREATSSLAVAVTGAAPIDQPTESVFFPVAGKGARAGADGKSASQSTPIRPVSRPVEPLIASLPERGSERRFTTVAAGLVMATAAIAMVAIVLGRSPGASPASAPPPSPTTQAAEVPPPPPAPPPAAPSPEPKMEEPAPPSAPVRAKQAAKAAAPASTPAETPRDRAKVQKTTQRTARGTRKDAGVAGDDDLVRLTNAAAQHAETAAPQPAPPAAPQPPPAEAPGAPPPLPSP